MPSSLARRLNQAIAEMPGEKPSSADLARVAGVKAPSVTDWFNGRTKTLTKALLPVAAYLGVTPEWLRTGKLPMRPPKAVQLGVAEAQMGYGSHFEIVILDAPWSFGEWSKEMSNGKSLVKDANWFTKRGVTADQLFGVQAIDDSMADYIVQGDTVIFDRTKTKPISGALFMVDHPAGPKIRRIRLGIDASWTLESLSPDKLKYPDERVPADQIDLIVIRGQFLYREG
jgi:hypothetical protein